MPRCLLTTLTWLLLALPAWAMPLEAVYPTQPEIGIDNVLDMVGRWEQEATKAQMPWPEWVQAKLKPRMEAQPIPGIIDTAGQFRNTDGHHRIAALKLVFEQTGVGFELETDVQGDFRGKSAVEMRAFCRKKWMLFPSPLPNVRWPADYGRIADNPLRSAVGNALYSLGIDSSHARPFIEFKIASRLRARGLVDALKAQQIIPKESPDIPSGRGTAPEIVSVVAKMIVANRSVARLIAGQGKTPAAERELGHQIKRAQRKLGREIARMNVPEREQAVSLLGVLKQRFDTRPATVAPRRAAIWQALRRPAAVQRDAGFQSIRPAAAQPRLRSRPSGPGGVTAPRLMFADVVAR